MLYLCRNQVVGFYQQNVWKHLWKGDILSKLQVDDRHVYLKCHSSTDIFLTFC